MAQPAAQAPVALERTTEHFTVNNYNDPADLSGPCQHRHTPIFGQRDSDFNVEIGPVTFEENSPIIDQVTRSTAEVHRGKIRQLGSAPLIKSFPPLSYLK